MKNSKGFGTDSKIFFDDTHKECSCCRKNKLHSEFHKDKNKYGLAYYCKECATSKSRKYHSEHQHEAKYREIRLNTRTKREYGLTSTQYLAKLVNQGSECTICGVKLFPNTSYTHLDHDHKTGKLRDFLCTNCNRGLGHFKDSPLVLEKAAEYLRRHSVDVDNIKEGT